MKLAIHYMNDLNGNIQAVQLSLIEWRKILSKIKKFEQILKVKTDLTEAFTEVEKIRKGKIKKQTLSDFLNEL